MYGPDGKVFLWTIDFPDGSWHYRSLQQKLFCTFRITMEVTTRSGDVAGILGGPVIKKQAQSLAQNLHPYLVRILNIYTSLWQASEWEMEPVQGTFPECMGRLTGNSWKYNIIIQPIIIIHKFRTEAVG